MYIYIETLNLPNKLELAQYLFQFFYVIIKTEVPIPLDISSVDLTINYMETVQDTLEAPRPVRTSSFLESKYVTGKLICRPGFTEDIKSGELRKIVANFHDHNFTIYVIPKDGFALYYVKTNEYKEMLQLEHTSLLVSSRPFTNHAGVFITQDEGEGLQDIIFFANQGVNRFL